MTAAERIEKRRQSKREWNRRNRESVRRTTRAWYEANRDSCITYNREWRRNNPELRNEQARKWRAANKEKVSLINRKSALRMKYGMTVEDYNALFEKQGRKCAICPRTEPGHRKGWHVDHCHSTGEVRGILCHGCNTGLGGFRDSPDSLKAAIDYLGG